VAWLDTPDKWFASPVQPPIHQPRLFPEPNSRISSAFHERESEAAAPGTNSRGGAQQIRNHGFREVHQQAFRDPKSFLRRIETGFFQHRWIDPPRSEIRGDKMKSPGVNIRRHLRFQSLRRRMINFPKARGAKFPMKRQGKRIEARAEDDDLCESVLKRLAREQGEAFFSQCIMTQDSGDGVFFEKLQHQEEPPPAGQSKKQSGSSRMDLKNLGVEIFWARPGTRVFLMLIDYEHACGNEQCRAAGVFVFQRVSIRLKTP
jgi:hypothetical protein